MARIPLTEGFTVVPEGTHIFRIYKVDYDQKFGKVTVSFVTSKGITHRENYNLMRDDGSANEGACNAFSYLAKTAMNDFSLEDIDPSELVDRYVKAEITHEAVPSNNDPTRTVTFARMGQKWFADGFEETPTARAMSLGHETAKPSSAGRTGSGRTAPKKNVDDFDISSWLNS